MAALKTLVLGSFMLLLGAQAFATETIFAPGTGVVTGTLSGGKIGLDVNVNSGALLATNPSVGTNGAASPSSSTYIGGNKSGTLTGLLMGQQTMANSLACVLPSDQSAIPVTGTFWQATQPISAAALPLPAGASTSAKQPALGTAGSASSDVITVQGIASMTALKVDGSAVTQPVSGTVTANVQGGNATAVKVDGSAVTQPVSGSVSVSNFPGTQAVSGTVTAKLQDNAGTAITVGQKVMASSLPVTIASDQSSVQVKAPLNSTGSGAAAGATVSTVVTLTAPANAVGAFLMNLDTSTANIRWAVGRTATTTLGQQLQPGRDVWIPTGANISLVAESGTQNYDVQWISQ